jgi:putative spermidine/putrescine transport system substrate-binding protein
LTIVLPVGQACDHVADGTGEGNLRVSRLHWLMRVWVPAALLLVACSGTGTSGSKALTFVSYGPGAYQGGQQQAWVAPFEKQTGAAVTVDSPSDNARIREMVDAGRVSWDVVDTDPFFAEKYCGQYTQKIDIGGLASGVRPGTLTDCGVPDAFFGLLFMYNTKTYRGKAPTRLADFFDPKAFPGKRSLIDTAPTNGRLEAALLADGVAPDKLYPLDINRALNVYGRVKSRTVFAQTFAQQQQAMVGGQVDLALVPSSRAYSVLESGGSFWEPVWDKTPVSWDDLVIPKGSPHAALAQDFIRFASQPPQAAQFASLAGLAPAITGAQVHYNALQQSLDPFDAQHEPLTVVMNKAWWVANIDEVTAAWSKWITS